MFSCLIVDRSTFSSEEVYFTSWCAGFGWGRVSFIHSSWCGAMVWICAGNT